MSYIIDYNVFFDSLGNSWVLERKKNLWTHGRCTWRPSYLTFKFFWTIFFPEILGSNAPCQVFILRCTLNEQTITHSSVMLIYFNCSLFVILFNELVLCLTKLVHFLSLRSHVRDLTDTRHSFAIFLNFMTLIQIQVENEQNVLLLFDKNNFFPHIFVNSSFRTIQVDVSFLWKHSIYLKL